MNSYGHTLGQDPTYVTGADRYRISGFVLLTPQHPDYDSMIDGLTLDETSILPEDQRPNGCGFVLLESEEHSVTFVGPVDHVRDVRDGTVDLDTSLGQFIAFWPRGSGWDAVIPANTWSKDGTGIVREFAHEGTSVIVYEYFEDRDGTSTPMVGWHCLRCHRDDLRRHHPNRGPQDRRWMAAEARKHMRRKDDCRPVNPRFAEVVTAVANDMHSTNNPVITHESHCSTTGRCGQIRHLRVAAATQAN
ncbi:MAG: hypothetical protein QOF58_2795 [Pseudonocardiales bacterium]|nr:hypothetical protein [Pseudonocardiales bacterium]